MHRHHRLLIVALALSIAGLSAPSLPAGEIRVDSALVRLIDDVEVPAEEAGVLKSLEVNVGETVEEGATLARLSDGEARLLEERAKLDLQTARKKEKNDVPLKLARKALADAELAVEKARLDLLIARKKAESDIRVRLAAKTAEVAKAELDRALKSREAVRDAVSQSEVDSLRLAVERAKLEIEQADLDREIAGLDRDVKEAEIGSLELAVERASLDVAQAEHERELAADTRRVKENTLELAALKLDRRRIVSPIGGVVVERFRQPGEWVEPGETVVRVVRMDRLRVEGFVDASNARGDLNGSPVALTVPSSAADEPSEFTGEIVFVSPEIDPVNNQVRVWADVENPEMRLRPGMRVSMMIKTGTAGEEAAAEKPSE